MMIRLKPTLIYLIVEGWSSLCLTIVVVATAVYRVQVVGLDPFQLILVGTVLEATAFIFEVPTGIFADAFSRKLSVIIGFVLIGMWPVLEGLFPLFAVSLLSQVVAGIGYTFVSGALQAWISDEIGVEHAGQVFLRGAQIGTLASILGTLIGIGLASIRLNLPLVAGGLCLVALSAFLIVVMPERAFKSEDGQTGQAASATQRAMLTTLREGVRLVRGNSLLLTILAIELFFGAYSEGFDRLWEMHFLKTFTFPAIGAFAPIVWIGAINLGSRLIVLAGMEIARRRVNTSSHSGVARALFWLNAALSGSMVIFGIAGGFVVGVGAFWSARLMRITIEPLADAWLKQNVEPHVRATTFSMRAQVNALGQIAGGPGIGLIADVIGLRTAIMMSGLLLTPALWLYRRSLQHQGAYLQTEMEVPSQD